MTHYEITYIIRPSLEDAQVGELSARMAAVVKEHGGDSVAVDSLGKKRLAYDLKKVREGHFVCMRFTGGADCAKEALRQLRLHEDVLRAILIKT